MKYRYLSLLLIVAVIAAFSFVSEVSAATFGYTSQGASEYAVTSGTAENPAGLQVTLSEDGTITSASMYGRRTLADKTVTISIYSDIAGARGLLLHTTQSGTINIASAALYTMNFASPPALSAGTYWLQVNIASAGPGSGNGLVNYDTGGGANTSYTLSDLGVPSYGTSRYSVYATYTPDADEPTLIPRTTIKGNVKASGNVLIK